MIKAWIYQAQHLPHYNDLFHVEIVAEYIKNLKGDKDYKIYIDRKYTQESISVVS